MLKMGSRFKTYMAGLAVAGVMAGAAVPAQAGDYSGDMLVRVQGTYLNFNDESTDLPGGRRGLELDDEFIPTLTLTYFLNKNLARRTVLLLRQSRRRSSSASGNVAEFWVFPPALTLQYHFDSMGAFKPYVGAGIQYILPFDEEGVGASGNGQRRS